VERASVDFWRSQARLWHRAELLHQADEIGLDALLEELAIGVPVRAHRAQHRRPVAVVEPIAVHADLHLVAEHLGGSVAT
jgi:hypothetical protein